MALSEASNEDDHPLPNIATLAREAATGQRHKPSRDAVDTGELAEELALRLQVAASHLMDRLFQYLATIKEDCPPSHGLTLPASALGWLSSQLYPPDDEPNMLWMGPSARDRLALLKFLLPRATHLRVTSEVWPPPKKPKTNSTDRALESSMVGQDLSLSDMSVHSALTMESFIPPRPDLHAFLLDYYTLQNRPRLDIRIFPRLEVLLLDRIPPEWIVNFHLVRQSLKLLRAERGCIYNITHFMFQEDQTMMFTELTHLKLIHCAIGELSGLRGGTPAVTFHSEDNEGNGDQVQSEHLSPPMSRLPNLVSLSLARNELRSVKTALAGLSDLPRLATLDLSFNRLTSMKNAHTMLGNLHTLFLTGNRIRNVIGLDRLYSLERLALDQNDIPDLASVAAVANLPQLSSLSLMGNPLALNDALKYRVEVFNLFRECRSGSLPPKATYRQILDILPILDGIPASTKELIGLRNLAFLQSVGVMKEASTTPEPATPTISNRCRDPLNGGVPTNLFAPLSTGNIRPQRVTKRRQTRKVLVEDVPSQLYDIATGNVADEMANDDGVQSPIIRFSVVDVISSLSMNLGDQGDEPSVSDESDDLPAPPLDPLECAIASVDDEPRNDSDTIAILEVSGSLSELAHSGSKVILQRIVLPDDSPNHTFISLPTTEKSHEEIQAEIIADLDTTQDSIGDESQTNPQSPGRKSVNVESLDSCSKASEIQEYTNLEVDHVATVSETGDNHTEDSSVTNKSVSNVDNKATESSENALGIFPRADVTFPEHVWDDDQSGLSSLGAGRESSPSENKYQLAEKNSTYDGPDTYKSLPVLVNLELYFRCFVFSSPIPETNKVFQDGLSDEEKSQILMDLAPRIQLRLVDRKAMEASMRESLHPMELITGCERFDKVWREGVLPCGKEAARRLTPYRTPKRGFHGDVLFSNGRLEKSCECRKLIFCASNAALYLMVDDDAVTQHIMTKIKERRFPLPIPQDALFENAPWPHAVARHPITCIRRITIGFGFQRLTLHVSRTEDAGKHNPDDEFTYVLLTCDKLRTISLLRQLQDHVREAKLHGPGLLSGEDMTIDNDDKQVLDALTAVVTPNLVGVVLHYQIVQQRWQHGDRGAVRRACIVTDTHLYLLDEDYVGDGSESYEAGARMLGDVCFKMVDSAAVEQITEVQAGHTDPTSITIVIRPLSRLQRTHRWRLICNDREGAERLVEDVRKAVSSFG